MKIGVYRHRHMNLKRLSHTIHYNTKLYPEGIRSIVRESDIENCTVKEKVLGAKSYQYLIFYAAQTVAARSLRGVFGSLDIKGDLCPAERVLYPCPRWRRSGHAATVVGNQSMALVGSKPFYRAIVPIDNEPSEEMYLYPAKQKAHMLLQIIPFRPR